MSPIHFMIAAFSLYVDFWCGVGFMYGKVAHDQPLVQMFMLWSVTRLPYMFRRLLLEGRIGYNHGL
jgi:hypothetical protein